MKLGFFSYFTLKYILIPKLTKISDIILSCYYACIKRVNDVKFPVIKLKLKKL